MHDHDGDLNTSIRVVSLSFCPWLGMSVALAVPTQQQGCDENGDAASLARDGESDI